MLFQLHFGAPPFLRHDGDHYKDIEITHTPEDGGIRNQCSTPWKSLQIGPVPRSGSLPQVLPFVPMRLGNLGVVIIKRTGEMTAGSFRLAGKDIPGFDHDNIDTAFDKPLGDGDAGYARSDDADISVDILVKLAEPRSATVGQCLPRLGLPDPRFV